MESELVKRGTDTPVSALSKLLMANQKQIELALPKHLRPERLIRLAVTALSTTPSLQDCSLLSICNSVMLAAQLGLEINNGMGHGWLIPYGKICTFQPGYRGLLELAYRSGRIKDARALLVYEAEPFTYSEGANPVFTHEPKPLSIRGEQWIGAYSRLTHLDNFQSCFWMWREEILEVRDKCSRTKDKGPWVTWFEEMVKKTALKRHLKTSQLSSAIALAVGVDDQAEAHSAKEETLKSQAFKGPVQDLVLDGSIIEDSIQADHALAGSREAQREVCDQKLKQASEPKKSKTKTDQPDAMGTMLENSVKHEAEALVLAILDKLMASNKTPAGMDALLRTASDRKEQGWVEMEDLKNISDISYLKNILENLSKL